MLDSLADTVITLVFVGLALALEAEFQVFSSGFETIKNFSSEITEVDPTADISNEGYNHDHH